MLGQIAYAMETYLKTGLWVGIWLVTELRWTIQSNSQDRCPVS